MKSVHELTGGGREREMEKTPAPEIIERRKKDGKVRQNGKGKSTKASGNQKL